MSRKRRWFAWLLAIVMAVSLLPGLAVPAAAADISGAITSDQTWTSNDEITAATTITGGPDAEHPVVITVTGAVYVNAKITVDSGFVRITGGGALLRGSLFTTSEVILVNNSGTSLTLDHITIDGNSVSTAKRLIIANPNSTLIMNEGATLQNNINTTSGPGQGMTLSIGSGSTFIMNNGEISNNTNGYNGTVSIGSGAFFTLCGGTINGNGKNAFYFASSAQPVDVQPKAPIEITGGVTGNTAGLNFVVTPVPGYSIASVSADNVAQSPGAGDVYTIPVFTQSLVIAVNGGGTQTQLTAPVLSPTPASVSSSAITLTAPSPSSQDASATVEYRVKAHGGSYGAWQSSSEFTGLTADTMYHFQARYKAVNTASYTDSDASPEIAVTTDEVSPAGTFTLDELTVNYFANYGGFITVNEATGEFTITAATAGYVIDTICVDGVPLSGSNDPNGETGVSYTFAGGTAGTHSIVAAFAYTLSFNSPANGTLSVSRDGNPLTSGTIVHGGDILTIAVTPDSGYEPDAFTLVGLHSNGNSTYTVFGTTAPSIFVSFKASVSSYDFTIVSNESPVHYRYSIWVNDVLKGDNVSPVHPLSGGVSFPNVANVGDTVKFVLDLDEGYGVRYFFVDSGGVTPTKNPDGSYSFTMRNSDVKLNIISDTLKTVTVVPAEGGTVTTSAGADFAGGSVTVAATPEAGYRPQSVSYSTDNGSTWTNIPLNGHTGSFSTSGNVTLVTAVFEEFTPTLSVSNETELRAFAAAVNGGDGYLDVTVSLTGNIALTGPWIPIGTAAHPFRGVFDAGGYTVSGMAVQYDILDASTRYIGLFGYVNAAIIQNMTVSGTVTAGDNMVNSATGTYPFAGGVVGYADGGSQLINCVNAADVSVPAGNTGGIAGDFDGTITRCVNYGHVTIRKNNILSVGGIAGSFEGTMEQCGNYGDVTVVGELSYEGHTDPYGSAGGIVGAAAGSIDGSFNKGAVTGWARFMGGVCGTLSGSTNVITDSYNTSAVRMTAGGATVLDADVAGLVGLVADSGTFTLTNCYNTGSVINNSTESRSKTGMLYCSSGSGANVTVTNCYPAGSVPTASALGAKYQTDVNNINGSTPLLWWEPTSVSNEEFPVTFATSPANATAKVFTDAERTHEVVPAGGVFSLKMGQYFYTVSATGFVTEKGSFNVTIASKKVPVTLRTAATVIFTVAPLAASFTLTDFSDHTVTPTSSSGGVYTFILYAGDVYTYTATAGGYNGITREFTATDGSGITVTLTKSAQNETNKTIKGGQTINEGGVYNLGRNGGAMQGVVTISTTEPVTLVGTGISLADSYENLYIDCAVAGVNLTIQNLYISNEVGSANMIDFMGPGNQLNFAGISILDMNTGATGYAMIHVNAATALTLGGVTPYDTLYFYKREQGAGIGGNGGATGGGQAPEYNGPITITGGNLFMKNSKQGALIGSGANAKAANGSPGSIIIQGGTLNLIAISRGAAIGGSAGGAGGATGTNVYIYPDACVNINVDYSGPAIGGGGYAEGNDSDGGILHYYGGSIRTFIDYNAVVSDGANLWTSYGVTRYGVNDAAITADKLSGIGRKVYLCTLDTSKLSTSASYFTVLTDGSAIYTGGLHQYHYVNESLQKNSQLDVTYTIDNWSHLSDANLYLYLTGTDHTLTVNGETFKAAWNSATKTFTVTKSSSSSTDTSTTTKTIDIDVTTSGTTSTAKVDGSALTGAISDAITEAAQSGKAPAIELSINAPDSATSVQAVIPATAFKAAADSSIQSLTVTTPIGSVKLDAKALDTISGAAKGSDVTIGVRQVDKTMLTTAQQKAVDDGAVLDLSITSGGTAIHDLGGGKATVTIPYTLKSGETADGIVIWYLDAIGKLTQIEGAAYDEASGTVTFTTAHFSLYVVGYDLAAAWQNPFTDVLKTAWYYKNVWFACTNGLFMGTGTATFSPDAPMTRAMFVTVLGRLDGVKKDDYTTSSFTDVPTGQYYSAYVEWAVKNNIVTGVGAGLFTPDKPVTREEMAAILYRYATFKKLDVAKADNLAAFTDASTVSGWAAPAMKWAVSEGIISGMGDGTLSPAQTATRAQVAAILERTDENLLK